MDETINIILGNSLSNPLDAFNIDIKKTEVLGGIVATDQVEDHVRVTNALFYRLGVAKVEFDKGDSPKVARDLEMSFTHFISVRNYDLHPPLR